MPVIWEVLACPKLRHLPVRIKSQAAAPKFSSSIPVSSVYSEVAIPIQHKAKASKPQVNGMRYGLPLFFKWFS